MSEEMNIEITTDEVVEQPNKEPEAPKVNPIEEKAKEKGWRPPDQFEGDPEDFVSAKEYLRVGEMIERQKNLERQLKLVAKQNQEIFKKAQEADIQGYQRAIEELKFQRKDALDVGDSAQADQLTEQMHAYQTALKQEQQKVSQNQVAPEIMDFLDRNKDWFRVDPNKTQLAILRDQELRLKYPNKTEGEILDMVENEFSPRKVKSTPPPLAAPSRSSDSPKGNYTTNDLTREELPYFKAIKEGNPDFTVNEFVQQMKAIGAR